MWLIAIPIGVALLALAIWHEQRQAAARRRVLFDACRSVLLDPIIGKARDGFPILSGKFDGLPVRCELIPDNMTVRRLPQLWLRVTVPFDTGARTGFGILRRYAGTEFYAITPEFDVPLEPVAALPQQLVMRGQSAMAQVLVERLAAQLAVILGDPRVKEVAVTDRGIRIIRQVAEGERGAHLILRQAVFTSQPVAAEDLQAALSAIAALRQALAQPNDALAGKRAAA